MLNIKKQQFQINLKNSMFSSVLYESPVLYDSLSDIVSSFVNGENVS